MHHGYIWLELLKVEIFQKLSNFNFRLWALLRWINGFNCLFWSTMSVTVRKTNFWLRISKVPPNIFSVNNALSMTLPEVVGPKNLCPQTGIKIDKTSDNILEKYSSFAMWLPCCHKVTMVPNMAVAFSSFQSCDKKATLKKLYKFISMNIMAA